MREYTLYMWLGVWLLILTSSSFGVPGTWKEVLTILTALFMIGHSLLGYRRARVAETAELGEEAVLLEEESVTI